MRVALFLDFSCSNFSIFASKASILFSYISLICLNSFFKSDTSLLISAFTFLIKNNAKKITKNIFFHFSPGIIINKFISFKIKINYHYCNIIAIVKIIY